MSRRKHAKSARNQSKRGEWDPSRIDWKAIAWSRIDRAFVSFDAISLITLLSAAADSPTCGHRLQSLSVLWTRAVTHPPKGVRVAEPSSLSKLLAAARSAAPQLRFLEDCWLADPRLLVCYPLGRQRFRIHSGALQNAPQLLRTISSTAEAIDPFVLDHYGFTLTDLLEVALRYSDLRLALLLPKWSTGPLFPDGDDFAKDSPNEVIRRISSTPAVLRDEELSVAVSSPTDSEVWTSCCAHPARAAAAWRWMTLPAQSIQIVLAPMAQLWGPVLAAEGPVGIVPVPAALVLSALAAATDILASSAAGDTASVRRMERVTTQRLLAILGSPSLSDTGQSIDLTSKEDQLLSSHLGIGMSLVLGCRHAFVISTVGGLDRDSLITAVDDADSILVNMDVGQLRAKGTPLEPSASLCRLVLYGSPYQLSEIKRNGVIHLHVEELASYLLEIEQTEAGSGLIWQFLDELATQSGIADLLYIDPSDVWRHWMNLGVLNPIGADEVTLVVDSRPDNSSWQIAANWEKVEAVLTNAGLPAVSAYPSAKLDEPGRATLRSSDNEVLLITADPPMVIITPLTESLPSLGIDPAFAIGIADGILLTCINFPEVAMGMALPNQRPLVIHLEFTTERPPESTNGQVGIGMSVDAAPSTVVGLLLGPDWLELLVTDPNMAHMILGEALAHCLDKAVVFRDVNERAVVRESFLSAWRVAPPVAILKLSESSLYLRAKGRVSLPRNHASKARALRMFSSAILKRKIATGEFVGPEAEDICRNQIVPALNDALKSSVADWSNNAILAVAEHLNDAHGERARVEAELEQALSAPWGEYWRTLALAVPEAAEGTRPIELLLELLLADTPTGPILPDQFDLAEVVELAHTALQIGLALSGAHSGLHTLALRIGDGGIVEVAPYPHLDGGGDEVDDSEQHRAPVRIDIAAYLEADRSHRFRLWNAEASPQSDEPVQFQSNRIRFPNIFIPLAKLAVPKSLKNADKKMRSECGTGIDGLMAVLGTAVSWVSGDDRLERVKQEELRDAALIWSSLTSSEIDVALDRLILDPAQLHQEGIHYWEQERRRYRLATRPLVRFDGSLLIIPWRIMATQGVYARYLLDGHLPWHPSDVPNTVLDAFNDFRQVANKELEREASKIASDLGLPHKKNIHENMAAKFGLTLPGEVDLLVADPARCRIWVCEVKDVSSTYSPSTLRHRLDKFLYDEDYIGKLVLRVEAVAANPDAAARLLSISEPFPEWRVLPLMITRHIEPAGFVEDVPVTFTVLADLAKTFQANVDPKHGHTLVGLD